MREHIQHAVYYFEVHLLYASFVWLAAWTLTSIRAIAATTKYWIWVAASLNFILPAGALADVLWAQHITWANPLGLIGTLAADILSNAPIALLLGVIWLLGSALMGMRLWSRIRSDQRDAKANRKAANPKQSFFTQGVRVCFAAGGQAPAVIGIIQPHILLPEGIDRLLSRDELNAVLIHELTHARRRDNLIRLVYEVALCLVWFHPLLWISGSRLALYRELSCDESVIHSARGQDLVSALAKLISPARSSLLLAAASSHLTHRLALLGAARPPPVWRAANAMLVALFSTVLFAGTLGTIAHTACCFVAHR